MKYDTDLFTNSKSIALRLSAFHLTTFRTENILIFSATTKTLKHLLREFIGKRLFQLSTTRFPLSTILKSFSAYSYMFPSSVYEIFISTPFHYTHDFLFLYSLPQFILNIENLRYLDGKRGESKGIFPVININECNEYALKS